MNARHFSIRLILILPFVTTLAVRCAELSPTRLPDNVRDFFGNNCTECHGPKKQKGQLRFDTFEQMSENARLDLITKVQEQIYLRDMPPEGSEQPAASERKIVDEWARGELHRNNMPSLDEKLAMPDRGNWVDHKLLFSGEIKEKPWSPARRWLVSPQIYQERVNDVFKLDGRTRESMARGIHGLSNPFTLPDRSGVKDYDLNALNGGHTIALRANAEWISGKMIAAIRIKNGEKPETLFENPKDKFYPYKGDAYNKKSSVPALEKIVLLKTAPTDADIADAIRTQFDLALKRNPTEAEIKKYTEFTRKAIGLAGNSEGLRQMLMAVLLESEFVYRVEQGDGAPDEFGRRQLSPREASFAIAYALGDKAPDEVLAKAAREGKLNTKQDYEREVRRLLADNELLAGIIDRDVTEKNLDNPKNKAEFRNYSDHPKKVRFFRDFFGYPMALGVFKDKERSDGYYNVPDRDSTQTPGKLVMEADMLVDWYLHQDKMVFERLLTGEEFFVAPVDKASEKMNGLSEVYERFKTTEWKSLPGSDKRNMKFAYSLDKEGLDFVHKRLNYNSNERDVETVMKHVALFKEKGLDPNPQWSYPFGVHMLMPHANSYNISPPDWNYPRSQPFKVEHRSGILTHPAWLIAFSQNSATDPVRRGKWVREKLLTGHVPDVPITVDAKIPDHNEKTLRERLDMVTLKQECWKCHQFMNPLGLSFEMYDDFGRFRTMESLEYPENIIAKPKSKYGANTYKTKAVTTTGKLDGTGDPKLDGDVKDAIELVGRLAKSDRVRQSIIRHAFRFYMGRNEMPSDSQTLIDADRAYVSSGGSFNAVIVSLLTSDSFMYRK